MKTITAALDILNCFTLDNHGQGVSEIARKLGMHKSKVSRILSTYENQGVVIKSQNTQKYHLGPKIMEWAAIVLRQGDLRTRALPHMEELRSKTQESVNLYIAQGDYRICIERLESPQGIRMVSHIGEPVPLHAGAAGKLLLAYFTDEKRRAVLERVQLSKIAANTITNREDLETELKKIAQQGFAISFQEMVPLAASIAAPIRNFYGEVIAALTVGGPVMRFTPQKVDSYARALRETADRISRESGYRLI